MQAPRSLPLARPRAVTAHGGAIEPFEGHDALRQTGMLRGVPARRLEDGGELVVDAPLVIVLDGCCSVDVIVGDEPTARRHTLRIVEGGAFVVPSAPIPGSRTRTVLRARARTRVQIVHADVLERWLRVPEFARAFAQAMLRTTGELQVSLAVARNPRVDRRLLLSLHMLADEFGKMTSEGLRLDLHLTHQQLGHLVGAARESITLSLKRLAARGDVTVRNGTILLRPLSLHEV